MYERYVLTHQREIAHLPVVTSILLFVVNGTFLQGLWGQNFTFLPPQPLALHFCIRRSVQSYYGYFSCGGSFILLIRGGGREEKCKLRGNSLYT